MAVQVALPAAFDRLRAWFRIPDQVPPFSTAVYRLFWAIWGLAFLVAVVGPAAGIYVRYAAPKENNFKLLLGSRAGIAVSEEDVTRIRFPVGPVTKKLGIRSGDDIIALSTIPVPDVVPLSDEAMMKYQGNQEMHLAQEQFKDLFNAQDDFDALVTIRSLDGRERTVTIPVNEGHIDAGARAMGIPPFLLNYVDLLHVITYPFLLWASWILHRRNARDAVSSILSLAILLTMATELPSFSALEWVGVPRAVHVFLYDVGNICLLAGILLFPHGKISKLIILLLCGLPILMFLHGDAYRAIFLSFMACAVYIQVKCLQRTPPGDLRQQIKYALYGFASYALFLGISISGDMLKPFVGSFGAQLIIEVLSGFSLGLAFLLLQLGLLIALLRYRLYDAESIISRTASFAIVTLVLGAGFAGIMEGIITAMQAMASQSNATGAAMAGAVIATVLIHPLHERVQGWAERRLHRNLLEFREGLPELVRDLREVAELPEFLHEVETRIEKGVRAVRTAVVANGLTKSASGISDAEVDAWMKTYQEPDADTQVECNPEDPLFPLRLRLSWADTDFGWLLIGPRPDGSVAGGDERAALIEVVDPVARALRIVLQRQKNEQELDNKLNDFDVRLSLLERMIASQPRPSAA